MSRARAVWIGILSSAFVALVIYVGKQLAGSVVADVAFRVLRSVTGLDEARVYGALAAYALPLALAIFCLGGVYLLARQPAPAGGVPAPPRIARPIEFVEFRSEIEVRFPHIDAGGMDDALGEFATSRRRRRGHLLGTT